MEQLKIETINSRENAPVYKTCAFTGHRHLEEDFSPSALKKAIKTAISDGIAVFYCGMAMGFDLLAAEYILKQKKYFPHVRLVACVPCYGQEKYFSDKDKKRYAAILKKADEQTILSDHYFNGCMQMRDKYMAERADILIAYCNKEKGGAAYTVKTFSRLKPDNPIIFI